MKFVPNFFQMRRRRWRKCNTNDCVPSDDNDDYNNNTDEFDNNNKHNTVPPKYMSNNSSEYHQFHPSSKFGTLPRTTRSPRGKGRHNNSKNFVSASESSNTLDETSSSSNVSLSFVDSPIKSLPPLPPWRTEKILRHGPPKQSDWWRETYYNNTAQEEGEEYAFVEDDRRNMVYSPIVFTEDDDLYANTNSGCKKKSEVHSNRRRAEEVGNGATAMEFYNCGYATWVQTREAWRNGSSSKRTNEKQQRQQTPRKGEPPQQEEEEGEVQPPPLIIPDSVKRDLVKCIIDRRHFELSRSIPLKNVIEAYCEAWAEGEGL